MEREGGLAVGEEAAELAAERVAAVELAVAVLCPS